MRKTLLSLALLSALAGPSQGNKEEFEQKAVRAKNKVKSVTAFVSDYTVVFGKLELSKEYKASKTKYGRAGDVIEEASYNRRGTVENLVSYENDKRGNNTAIIAHNPDGSVHHRTACMNDYDSLGRLKMVLMFQNDTVLFYKVLYWYDKGGCLEQADYYKVFEKSYMDSYEKYSCDANGRTARAEYFDNAGNYQSRIEFRYEAGGRLLEKTDRYMSVFKYGPGGLATEVRAYGESDTPASVCRLVYEYYQ